MKALTAVLAALLAMAAADPERVRAAKALYFDRKYAEARQAWQEVLQGATGREADTAAYWVARSSESLGEHARAFAEFGAFLGRGAADRQLVQEAKTHRLGLAARLYREGKRQHLGLLQDALRDPDHNVRDFAALQLSNLGPKAGAAAVPVLKEIVARSGDEDMVQRAKLGLLRLDPAALAQVPPRGEEARPPGTARWMELRIYEAGRSRPKVYVRLPLAVAEILFKSLPDEARAQLRQKGYDAENFWDQLEGLGPGQMIDIRSEDGDRIQISLE